MAWEEAEENPADHQIEESINFLGMITTRLSSASTNKALLVSMYKFVVRAWKLGMKEVKCAFF
jgi:hypothetical protein